jgi:D-amino-acid dehydrogenase
MARVDVAVLGAGIVGTSVALHLVKRGLSVALIDRKPPGEETSFGNAGIIEGNTIFPPAFPSDFGSLLRILFRRAPEASYHFNFPVDCGAVAFRLPPLVAAGVAG